MGPYLDLDIAENIDHDPDGFKIPPVLPIEEQMIEIKDLAHLWLNLLVDFLHKQYIDFMLYRCHSKTRTVTRLYFNTGTRYHASSQYHEKRVNFFTLIGFPPSPLIPCMDVRAVCCSISLPKRMKPNPLLVPVSSKTTETAACYTQPYSTHEKNYLPRSSQCKKNYIWI